MHAGTWYADDAPTDGLSGMASECGGGSATQYARSTATAGADINIQEDYIRQPKYGLVWASKLCLHARTRAAAACRQALKRHQRHRMQRPPD